MDTDGFAAGLLVPVVGFDTGIRAHNLESLVFFVILPVLIFETSWHLDTGRLRRQIVPILVFATLGILICCLVTACLLYVGIDHSTGFPW